MQSEIPKRTRRPRGKVQVICGKPNHFKKLPSDINEKIDSASRAISQRNNEADLTNRTYFAHKRILLNRDEFDKNP
jgi:hypothetical protein